MSDNVAARSTDSLRRKWSREGREGNEVEKANVFRLRFLRGLRETSQSKVYNRRASMEIPAMQNVTSMELSRDVDAVQIPHGAPVTLPKGTPVDITQTLGGTFTVHAQGGLYRISGKDADALGLEPPAEEKRISGPPVDVDEKQIWEILRSCYDPEIPVNIVDLGLVYDLAIEKLPSGFS